MSGARIGCAVGALLLAGCAGGGPYGISFGSPGSTSGEAVDVRVTRVEGRLDAMSKRIDAVGERMEGVEGGVIRAQDTADRASRRVAAVDSRLTRLWTNRFNQRAALDYNYGLSQRRVNAVRRFLMDRGINLARIHAASLGPATEANISEAKKRRVTIRLMVDQE